MKAYAKLLEDHRRALKSLPNDSEEVEAYLEWKSLVEWRERVYRGTAQGNKDTVDALTEAIKQIEEGTLEDAFSSAKERARLENDAKAQKRVENLERQISRHPALLGMKAPERARQQDRFHRNTAASDAWRRAKADTIIRYNRSIILQRQEVSWEETNAALFGWTTAY